MNASERRSDASYPIGRVYTDLCELPPTGWLLIDMDSGTVVGTNVVLVERPTDDALAESILDSDMEALNYGHQHGYRLYAPVRP